MLLWKQALSIFFFFFFWQIYLESPVSVFFLCCFVKDLQVLYVNPSYLKCISDINSSPANKNLFTTSFILYLVLTCSYLSNKRGATKSILLKGVFIPKLLNNPLVSCSLINFYFVLSHTAHFDKNIILSFFVLGTFGFLISVFFLHFKQYDNFVL